MVGRKQILVIGVLLAMLSLPLIADTQRDGDGPSKIVGGGPVTNPDQMPFVVFIDGGRWFCTGSVIAPTWVLTAAHCVVNGDGSLTHPGDIEIQKRTPHEREVREVMEIRVPPGYVYSGIPGFIDDLALIRVSHPFTHQEGGIVPIVDLEEEQLHAPSGTISVMAGYGLRENDTGSDGLRRVDTPMYTPEDCWRRYVFQDEMEMAHERTLCAGTPTKRFNSGDSGGPLLVRTRDGEWFQVGVHSISGRDSNGRPVVSIATRVSSLHDWIMNQIEYRLYFAHYVAGEGADTNLVLVNPSPRTTVFGEIKFLSPEGDDITDSLIPKEKRQLEILPLGTFSISPSYSGEGLVVGGAMVESDGELTGSIRFRLEGVGMTSVRAGRISPSYRTQQLHNAPKTQALIPVSGGDLRTGVAIFNHQEEEISVRWFLLDPSGERVRDSGGLEIPALGHMARFTDEVFSGLDSDFQGSLLVGSWGSEATVLGLELGSRPGELSTLPVTDIQEWIWNVW